MWVRHPQPAISCNRKSIRPVDTFPDLPSEIPYRGLAGVSAVPRCVEIVAGKKGGSDKDRVVDGRTLVGARAGASGGGQLGNVGRGVEGRFYVAFAEISVLVGAGPIGDSGTIPIVRVKVGQDALYLVMYRRGWTDVLLQYSMNKN